MNLSQILTELSTRKGRKVSSMEYPTLLALLEDWHGFQWGRAP